MITINPGQVALFTAFSADANNNPAPTTGGTATISDYASAYVASTGKQNEYMVVSKTTLQPGQKLSLSVVFSGAIAADGTTVASLSIDLELDGQPQSAATQIVLGPVSTPDASTVIVPSDPGSATIPMA